MKRHSYLLLGVLVITALVLGACKAAATDAPALAAPTDVPAAEPTDAPPEPTDEPVDTGLLMGMSAEELADAGYVVIAPGDPIRIGASVALTGPIPDPGRDIANGNEIAIDDLNADGGYKGHVWELVLEDGACDGDAGTVVANKFASDPSIVAVAGGTCTGETLGLAPILEEAKIPFMSPSATNPAITTNECSVCNRVALSDLLQGNFDAAYVINTLGITKVAIMHDSADYGLGLAELFQEAFVILGGTVTDFSGVQVGDTDFRAPLTQIATNAPELIFFGGYATEAGLIASQMKEVGLADAIFMSDDGAYTKQYLDTAGANAEGTYASFVSGDEVAAANDVFDAKYLDKYGVSPDDMGPFHGQAHDAVVILADAIMRVAQVDDAGEGYLIIERAALLTAIRDTQNLQGIMGVMTCNAIGDCGAGGIQLFQVQDGAWVQVSGFGLD